MTHDMTVHQAMNFALQRHQAGDLAQAEAIYRQILARNPRDPAALNMLGVIAYQTNQPQTALDLIQQAIAINPSEPDYYCNLGLALAALGHVPQSIAAYHQCLSLNPTLHEAWYNLGNVSQTAGKVDEAIVAYRQCLALHPDHLLTQINLGSLLRATGRTDEAVDLLRGAIARDSSAFQAYNNLGNALQDRGANDEAIDCFTRAIALKPNHPTAHNNLANGLLAVGKLDAAIAGYEQAISLQPYNAAFAGNRLFALQFRSDFDTKNLLRQHQQWNDRHAAPLRQFILPHDNDRSPDRRLRIGYVSPDFRAHCQSLFTTPLLANHDHDQVEVFCYAGETASDAVTARLRGYADTWRPIARMNDQAVANLVRSDGIDILVDLTMHMAGGRPLLMARKPAPVQVTWLAYPGTTGISAIDYRLTDPYLDPTGLYDDCYSEISLRLPDTFWCYDAHGSLVQGQSLPNPQPPPVLKNGFITFGCLNNICKLRDQTLQLWSRVLRNIGGARLSLWCPLGRAREWMTERLIRAAINPAAVDFVARQPRQDYLAEFNRIDISLDTAPYNGHTTSLDSLWMGVPLITLVGQTVVGRAGLSQLSNLQLTELVATTDEQFVHLASELANDVPRLAELHNSLRQRMLGSPLTDGRRFTQNVEGAYRRMWRNWCDGAGSDRTKS